MMRRTKSVSPGGIVFAGIALFLASGCGRNTYTPSGTPSVTFAARLAEQKPVPGAGAGIDTGGGRIIYLHSKVELNNADIKQTGVKELSASDWAVTIELTPQGATKLSRVTGANQGKLMALMFNGKVITAPTIHATLGSSFVLEGGYSEQEARGIAKGLAGQQ